MERSGTAGEGMSKTGGSTTPTERRKCQKTTPISSGAQMTAMQSQCGVLSTLATTEQISKKK
eukprot:8505356-Ditylum_brightwellii.AAC.1